MHKLPTSTAPDQPADQSPINIKCHVVSPWWLLRLFLVMGSQSFGGGPAMLFLMRRKFVDEHQLVSDAEFTQAFALSQATPGINLISLALVLGWRLSGPLGGVLAPLGMLLPSVTITIAITVLYALVRQFEVVQAALHGVFPATIGLMILLLVAMARPLLQASWLEGRGSLLFNGALLLGGVLLAALKLLPIIAIMLLGGVVGAVGHWLQQRQAQAAHTGGQSEV